MYYTQDGFTLFAPSSTGNNGLFTVATNNVPDGCLQSGRVSGLTTPVDQFPVSEKTVFRQHTAAAIRSMVQNQICRCRTYSSGTCYAAPNGARITVEARYVGIMCEALSRLK